MGCEGEGRAEGYSTLASSDARMEEVPSTEAEMQGTEEIWREENFISSVYEDSEASTMTFRQLEIQLRS